MLARMAANLAAVAGDECVCQCHRDSSIRHVAACCAHCAGCDTKVRTPALTTHQPDHCAGFRAGRLSLRVDAVVCAVAGLVWLVLGFTHALTSMAWHVVIGVALILWAVVLLLAPRSLPLRGVLALVTVMNVVALIATIVAAIVADGAALTTIAVIAAVVIVLFAVWEYLALQHSDA